MRVRGACGPFGGGGGGSSVFAFEFGSKIWHLPLRWLASKRVVKAAPRMPVTDRDECQEFGGDCKGKEMSKALVSSYSPVSVLHVCLVEGCKDSVSTLATNRSSRLILSRVLSAQLLQCLVQYNMGGPILLTESRALYFTWKV